MPSLVALGLLLVGAFGAVAIISALRFLEGMARDGAALRRMEADRAVRWTTRQVSEKDLRIRPIGRIA